MAVNATPVDSALRLTVQTGTDAAGNPIYARYRFSRIKATAADQDVYDVALVLAGLQAYPLAGVERSIEFGLSAS
ncbi:MAG: DUF1659 domain-containing protein [Clostridia bacterium]|nr:DUF1659 domain-containing protein [Clostridia bacterium]